MFGGEFTVTLIADKCYENPFSHQILKKEVSSSDSDDETELLEESQHRKRKSSSQLDFSGSLGWFCDVFSFSN